MKLITWILLGLLSLTNFVHAEGETLTIGTESFSPPFIMQGANNAIYGFDIDMMNSLCKILNRTCVFKVMRFEQLIPALQNKTIDAAVSSITITMDRAKLVNFSNPYALSYSRFLSLKSPNQPAFSLDALSGKKIGVETGTVFTYQIMQMGIKNPVMKEYDSVGKLLEGLNAGEVDYILVDNPTAVYWAANSGDSLTTVGPAFSYGYGYGIAIQPSNNDLLKEINQALVQYENSPDYKQNYNRYLAEF